MGRGRLNYTVISGDWPNLEYIISDMSRILSQQLDEEHPLSNYVFTNGSRAFTGNQSMGSHRLTNVLDPIYDQDAVTKKYVDDIAATLVGTELDPVFSAWLIATPPLYSVTAHNLLSATHGDTLADNPILGDVMVGNATPTPKWSRLAGQITTTRKFLRQTGNAAISAVPVWDTILDADIPSYANWNTAYSSIYWSRTGTTLTPLNPGDNITTTGIATVGANGLKILEGGATPTLYGIFSVPDLSSADKTYTFPTVSGSIAYSFLGTYANIDNYINQQVFTTSTPTFAWVYTDHISNYITHLPETDELFITATYMTIGGGTELTFDATSVDVRIVNQEWISNSQLSIQIPFIELVKSHILGQISKREFIMVGAEMI